MNPKTFILSLLFITAGFAEHSLKALDLEKNHMNEVISQTFIPQQNPEKNSYTYIKFSGGENNFSHLQQPAPGLGLGIRFKTANAALDLSISGLGISEHKSANYQYMFPKIGYINYLPSKDENPYYTSLGLGWGVRHNSTGNFTGIIAHGGFGYEFVNTPDFLSFSEICLYQPLLAIHTLEHVPLPSLEVSLGCGF